MSRKSKQSTITAATHEAAALSMHGATDKERLNLTPAEFRQQLALHTAEVKDLVRMALKVGALKSGQHLKLSNGQTFGRKELNALVSQHNRTLRQLTKNYTARGTRKRRVTQPGRRQGEGFAKGSFLQEDLINFLKNANFGTVNGPSGGGQAVRDVIAPLLEKGLLSRSLLTVLLTIYEFANGLRTVVDGKKYFSAGPEMERYLGAYLAQLEASDRAKTDADLVDKKGKMKPRFDRRRFVYNRLQSIANPGIFEADQLTEQHRAYLEDAGVKQALQDAQSVLSATLKQWNP